MDRFSIDVDSLLPDYLPEFSNELPYMQSHFGNYLLRLIFSESQDPVSNQKNTNREHVLETRMWKGKSPHVRPEITVHELVPFFMEECTQRFMHVNKGFATYLIHLLVRDVSDGLDLVSNKGCLLSVCKLEQFLERCLNKYGNPLDPTICNMKMSYYFTSCHELSLDFVNQKYETNSKEKLSQMIRCILQYPETSNQNQLEEMFMKMQIFIITNYQIGCPHNHVLIKQTRQSLNSVLGKGDLQKYVLKKRYNRIEYLQRLGATVCGIVIFNNYKSQVGNENGVMRNIFSDLEMAQRNTKEFLEQGLKQASVGVRKGTTCMQNVVQIRVAQQNVQCLSPMSKVREINKFVILFHVYKRSLEHVKPVFEKIQHLIQISQKKFNCVVDKIRETIKFRSAIESELVFPHFVYLSEVWMSFILYLNQLAEINKIMEHLEEFVSNKLDHHYNTIVEEISTSIKQQKYTTEHSFKELIPMIKSKKENLSINKNPFVADFCALTIVLTKGLLVPSKLHRKLHEDSEIHFGFANAEFANYSERNFANFAETLNEAIFSNVDLMLLFAVDSEVMHQDFDLVKHSETKSISSPTQTEFATDSDLSTSKRLNVTWNVWDYHRETIRLANMRQKQTHSNQSNISFGHRNTQTQAYDNRENFNI